MSNDIPAASIAKLVSTSPDGDDIIEYPNSPIRSFLDSNIQQQIDAAVATLGENDHGAVVPYLKYTDGIFVARLAVMAKLFDQWSVVVAFEKQGDNPVSLEAGARFRW